MTLHYHGTPITPRAQLERLAGRCFCVSFAEPRDIGLTSRIAQSLMLDNGAFSAWRSGYAPDWPGYYAWVEQWLRPADFAVIPDVIDGDAEANDGLLASWPHGHRGAPVWHLHEPIGRLQRLVDEWPVVCLGSSGAYAQVGTDRWAGRMGAAFNAVCRGRWVPRLHGLRMMAQVERWPFSSVDSADVARNHSAPQNDAAVMVARWDARNGPARWTGWPEQMEMVA